jgi:hypothetical protein
MSKRSAAISSPLVGASGREKVARFLVLRLTVTLNSEINTPDNSEPLTHGRCPRCPQGPETASYDADSIPAHCAGNVPASAAAGALHRPFRPAAGASGGRTVMRNVAHVVTVSMSFVVRGDPWMNLKERCHRMATRMRKGFGELSNSGTSSGCMTPPVGHLGGILSLWNGRSRSASCGGGRETSVARNR